MGVHIRELSAIVVPYIVGYIVHHHLAFSSFNAKLAVTERRAEYYFLFNLWRSIYLQLAEHGLDHIKRCCMP